MDLDRVMVSEAMRTEVQTAGPEDGLTEAAARMAEHKIGCLPITEKGKLIGLVTVTDILAGEVRASLTPSGDGKVVGDIMTRDPLTVHRDDLLSDAAARMQKHRIRHLPVVDAEMRAIGMLSDRDIRQVVGDLRTERRDPRTAVAEYRVADAMSEPIVSVKEDTSLARAAQYFANFGIGAVAVVDQADHLIGIASYIDLLNGMTGARA
jgi:CBS domain-containing protein